ncbi:hypothetical protein WJX84_008131 [Apatococcus fuscideae]|uniref:Uncharacterized protein n=1 Tax=Apatococcus fuscideae TaxID=2026836 RepID=A0AAW1SX09_9CHLO
MLLQINPVARMVVARTNHLQSEKLSISALPGFSLILEIITRCGICILWGICTLWGGLFSDLVGLDVGASAWKYIRGESGYGAPISSSSPEIRSNMTVHGLPLS